MSVGIAYTDLRMPTPGHIESVKKVKETIQRTNPKSLRWYRIAALLLSLVVAFRTGYSILTHLNEVKGFEAYWIAKAIVAGEGFSMPNPEPWGKDVIDTGYHPSAWVDPLYTYTLAGMIWLFGPSHQFAAALLNLVMLLIILGLTYLNGERLISPAAGLFAILLLAANSRYLSDVRYMNNTMLAGALIAFSMFMLIRFAEKTNYRRAVELGLALGITALGCPSAQLFIFVTAIAIVLSGWKNKRSSVAQASLMIVIAFLIMSPWHIRNYLLFGTYIPIRTGGGWSTFAAICAPAATVSPEKFHSQATPPWRASTIREAVRRNASRKPNLDGFQMDYALEVGGSKFIAMDEAQRDSWFLEETKKFARANPIIAAKIALRNEEVFVLKMGLTGIFVCLFAAIGALLSVKTPLVLTLAFWAGTFIGPFLMIICYYSRYRAPIEPLLILLMLFAFWRMFRIGRHVLGKAN